MFSQVFISEFLTSQNVECESLEPSVYVACSSHAYSLEDYLIKVPKLLSKSDHVHLQQSKISG